MSNERWFATNELYPLLGYSRYRYQLPVRLPKTIFREGSPAHIGQYKHAVDIAVPSPDKITTVVYSPAAGKIIAIEMSHTNWGPTPDFQRQLNYICIQPGNDREFVEVAHIRPFVGENGKEQQLVRGDHVDLGQPIGIAALVGMITCDSQGNPMSHVHMMVGEWLNEWQTRFRSLKIRWLDRTINT